MFHPPGGFRINQKQQFRRAAIRPPYRIMNTLFFPPVLFGPLGRIAQSNAKEGVTNMDPKQQPPIFRGASQISSQRN